MPTLNQLRRKPRQRKEHKKHNRALHGCPQKSGTVIWVGVMTPKKPNSANRKVCDVRLKDGIKVKAYIPGIDHTLQIHNNVLIRAGCIPDLPGVRYKVIRGTMDCDGVKKRRQARSKYGAKRPQEDGAKK